MSLSEITTAEQLDRLPVGSVILDSGRNVDQHSWEKTDDTDLRDEYHEREHTAWVSIAWTRDHTAADLENGGFLPARLLFEATA